MSLFLDLILDKLKLTPYHRRRKKYNIGEHTYICHTTKIGSAKIGKYCSIASDTVIGIGNHPMNFLTTSPFIYSRKKVGIIGNILVDEDKLVTKTANLKGLPPTNIGHDVWIGERAIILLGVNVGNGAVIGAGAIVTKDVPPYAIVAGVPAKVIKYRFEKEIIDKLQDIKWWDYPEDFLIKLPFHDLNKCIKILDENIHLRKQ